MTEKKIENAWKQMLKARDRFHNAENRYDNAKQEFVRRQVNWLLAYGWEEESIFIAGRAWSRRLFTKPNGSTYYYLNDAIKEQERILRKKAKK